ncbi:hypothetical protein JTB14_029282 [Gonioctena quinquepunctata]|nr:hypothetical protein JTB14_029282 [Gonioctena quinquepunctata]
MSKIQIQIFQELHSMENTKKVISEKDKDIVRKHISFFPAVESHYCRANSTETYLERNLNLQRMYDLYKTDIEKPDKLCSYRMIFNTEFNISFFKPKKDLCDKCQTFNVIQNPTKQGIRAKEEHMRRKNIGKAE